MALFLYLGVVSGSLFGAVAETVLAGPREPLLMADKKNLYQRVLTLPEAQLYQQARLSEKATNDLPPFSISYVYRRVKDSDNLTWLQVGLGRKGNVVG